LGEVLVLAGFSFTRLGVVVLSLLVGFLVGCFCIYIYAIIAHGITKKNLGIISM